MIRLIQILAFLAAIYLVANSLNSATGYDVAIQQLLAIWAMSVVFVLEITFKR